MQPAGQWSKGEPPKDRGRDMLRSLAPAPCGGAGGLSVHDAGKRGRRRLFVQVVQSVYFVVRPAMGSLLLFRLNDLQ